MPCRSKERRRILADAVVAPEPTVGPATDQKGSCVGGGPAAANQSYGALASARGVITVVRVLSRSTSISEELDSKHPAKASIATMPRDGNGSRTC
jgi:hypothetical protein